MDVKRGNIVIVDVGLGKGSEQSGNRPAVVIQNDVGNKFSHTTIVALITSKETKANIPTHVPISKDCGLNHDSIIMAEQIRVIDSSRIMKICNIKVPDNVMNKLNEAIRISLNV